MAAWASLALVTGAVALTVPNAGASPETEAQDAITAAWDAAGGEASPLGAPQGDAHPVGVGFVQDFAGGKVFFTPETGAKSLYGAILEKYEAAGGPANSDLGFPNIDEVPGLVSPESRVATFSAGDNPVIYWTPEHGAYVVRGVMNAGWDRLDSSTGPLGVPVADESYEGAIVTQRFSGGQLSWSSQTGAFTTAPPELADQLADLQIPVDPAAAISRAWRATGGASGPLGARQGEQYQVGTDGAAQDFAGGKVYFSPATGASAVEGDVLAKYESLGGPAGSDLGFPIANEADGSIAGSRVSGFSAADQPVIFAAPEKGAFVVRGAMKAAWDALGGAAGALGAPAADQSVEGERVSQEFTGGTVFWDRTTNTYSTDPSSLAKSLSGLHIPGSDAPNTESSVSAPAVGGGSGWHWWWLWAALATVAVLAVLAWLGQYLRHDRRPGAAPGGSVALSGDDAIDDQWSVSHGDSEAAGGLSNRYGEPSDVPASDPDLTGESVLDPGWTRYGPIDEEDSDDADTAPTRIPSEAEFGRGRHAVSDEHQAGSDAGLDHVDPGDPGHPMMHLPLRDPYEAPDGYPVKASVASGLYYTAESVLYDDTLAEIWFADEESAERNGFVKAR